MKLSFLDIFFKLSIFIKGIDGFLETIGGLLLLFISQRSLNGAVVFLTQHELAEDPKDLVSNYLVGLMHNFSVDIQLFVAIYLICHGIIKVFLVASLLKNKLWAYPFAAVFFTVFVIYEIYRYSLNQSMMMLFLAIFDILVVSSILLEYKRKKSLKTV